MRIFLNLLLTGIVLCSYVAVSAQHYVDTVNVVQAYQVPVYQVDSTQKHAIINMAYASADMRNPEAWTSVSAQSFPIEIDLVYTNYPLDYNKWRCNYDKILNARIKNLIELDPIFRAIDVKWNLVIQTNCKTEDEAKLMFHGIVIKYQPRELIIVAHTFEPNKPKGTSNPRPTSNPTSLVKETTPAAVPSVPKEFLTSTIAELEIPPIKIYGDEVEKIEDIIEILRGEKQLREDSTVFAILNRHPEWKNSLIVMDWTASMYQYGAQLLMWHRLNLEKNVSQVSHFVFFNDGNRKWERDKDKPVGTAGGVYWAKTNSLQEVIITMRETMNNGTGGGVQENDLEAVLFGIKKVKDFDDIILISDNTAVRDMALLQYIKKPIHVIICDSKESFVSTDYLRIAFETGGSLHTLAEDIMDLSQLAEDNPLTRQSGKYEMREGHLVRIVEK